MTPYAGGDHVTFLNPLTGTRHGGIVTYPGGPEPDSTTVVAHYSGISATHHTAHLQPAPTPTGAPEPGSRVLAYLRTSAPGPGENLARAVVERPGVGSTMTVRTCDRLAHEVEPVDVFPDPTPLQPFGPGDWVQIPTPNATLCGSSITVGQVTAGTSTDSHVQVRTDDPRTHQQTLGRVPTAEVTLVVDLAVGILVALTDATLATITKVGSEAQPWRDGRRTRIVTVGSITGGYGTTLTRSYWEFPVVAGEALTGFEIIDADAITGLLPVRSLNHPDR